MLVLSLMDTQSWVSTLDIFLGVYNTRYTIEVTKDIGAELNDYGSLSYLSSFPGTFYLHT